MTTTNFSVGLNFVWLPQYDSPDQGFHVTPGDPGGGTFGGVIQSTWNNAVNAGLVTGALSGASRAQLSTILQTDFWGVICNALPAGLDLLYFNGIMMTGRFPELFQQCLGFMGEDVDGWIGPESLAKVATCQPATLINAISGVHAAYLAGLSTWAEFGNGWTTRLKAAQAAALSLAVPPPVVQQASTDAAEV